MHASFWGTTHAVPELGFVTSARDRRPRGYVPAPAVKMLLDRALPTLPRLRRLWGLLHERLRDTPVALLHGDCRPENLLFRRAVEAEEAEDEEDEEDEDAEAAAASAGAAAAWRVTFLDWEAVGVNPAANDLIYFMVVGLRAADSERWEKALLREYHRELCAAAAAASAGAASSDGSPPSSSGLAFGSYSLAQLEAEVALLGGVLLVVQAAFAVTDVFKGWGNNQKNRLPWLVRLCRYTMRIDAHRLCRALGEEGGPSSAAAASVTAKSGAKAGGAGTSSSSEDQFSVAEILESMRARASEGLDRLRAEHGAQVVDAL